MQFGNVQVLADGAAQVAGGLLRTALERRLPFLTEGGETLTVRLIADEDGFADHDAYRLEQDGACLTVTAHGTRGLIYGYSHFLRKADWRGVLTITEPLNGVYRPDKAIRGHQLGYRPTPNTYDAWTHAQYFQYYLELMAFGSNTVEHIPYEEGHSNRNCLMIYDEEEFLCEEAELCDLLDLNLSLWHPNRREEPREIAAAVRGALYERLCRLDAVFPPGGDPGDLPADEFIARCSAIGRELKKSHPHAAMWPSAQQPHNQPGWGEVFLDALAKDPPYIDGVVMGPNHAFPLKELRERLPDRYPIRFYPDFTHNLRCEYPVHYDRDDWHFAWAAALSRESVNPRPREFTRLHHETAPYVVGSVSYSEGVHDDVNKAVWARLDWSPDADPRDTLLDYARCFFPGTDAQRIADAIFGLEDDWDEDPLTNPAVENTYRAFCSLRDEYPFLMENWRFVLLYFRAVCDMAIALRRREETALCDEARRLLAAGDADGALRVTETPLSETYGALRREIDALGKTLFDLIGIQLDVEHYHAMNRERGAVLDTIDNPVTDLPYLRRQAQKAAALSDAERQPFIAAVLERCAEKPGEVYWSYALHGLDALGEKQVGEYYSDVLADRAEMKNDALPVCLAKAFDHYTFRAAFGGLIDGRDYELQITYRGAPNERADRLRVTAGDSVLYEGPAYGGRRDTAYENALLTPRFCRVVYDVPAASVTDGTLALLLEEPTVGIEVCELRLKPKM